MKQFFTAFFTLMLLTGAGAQVLYQQNFEDGFQDMTLIDNDGQTPASALAAFPDAWNISADLDGNAAFSISWYTPAGQSDDWMITPEITGITAKTVLEWDARAVDASYPDGYKVMVSIGGATIADFTDEIFETGGEEATGAYKHRSVLLGDYAGKTIHIAFVNNANDQYVLVVDNILVHELPDVDVSFLKVDVASYVLAGEANYLNYTVKNQGFQPITTLILTWSDGTGSHSETVTGLNLQFGDEYDGTLTDAFTADNPEEYPLNFSVATSSVDNLPDNNGFATTVVGVSIIVPKRVVAEEATGTWCGWCPRGAVFMELMTETFPEDFIPIAVHNATTDPMRLAEYDDAITSFPNFPGFPSVIVDRKQIIDPSELEASINALREVVAPVAVDVHATIDSIARKVYIEGKVTTYANRTTAKYNLVLVVAENDVRGTAAGYKQTNYYAANANGPMGGYESLPNPVPSCADAVQFRGSQADLRF